MIKKPNLPVPVHTGRNFTWTGRHGVIEASEIRGKLSSRLWDDACDEGFYVNGNKASKLFVFKFAVHALDGDVHYWFFQDAEDPSFTISVFND